MIKLLGFIDLIAAVVFILIQWNIGVKIAIIIAIYLIVKSLLFIGDVASVIDLMAGVYLILILLGIHSAFSFIFVIWLLQKGIFSLVS